MSLSAARPDHRPERLSDVEARRRLEEARTSRLAQLAALENGAQPAGDDLLVTQTSAIRRALADIDSALLRLDSGTYGSCQDCGAPIPVERLEILPYARCCVGCQRRSR